ncbi:MAG: [protein-PII] uridylyltransferase, partial [Dongiales bacterium]
METIRDQRAVIDRRRLSTSLADAGAQSDAALLEVLKRALAQGRAEIRRRFEAEARAEDAGLRVGHETCFLMDQLIRTLYDYTTQQVFPLANPSAGEHLALVAVGGYGRGELAPASDIDLLFLLPYKLTPHGEQVVEFMLYRLWDLGLKVGHATRSVDECIRQAKADMTIRTGLLESRFLWGDTKLFQELKRRFRREVATGNGLDFVEAKLAERDQRHKRTGNSRYTLEPNIKEGKGGLRDLHTLYWIAKYLYQVDEVSALVERGVLSAAEVATFEKAAAFLWTVRCHLHYLAGRAEERLTFDLQPELARRMGYTDHAGTLGVERLMKHYFLIAKSVGDLTRIFCAAIEAAHQRRPFLRLPSLAFPGIGLRRREIEGFAVEGDRLNVPDPELFTSQPINILRLFEVAQRRDLDIHPTALRLVTRHLKLVKQLRSDPEANRLFLAMLTSPKGPEITLRRLNEAGVFGRFIPDFGRVVAQMQYDMYHHYTVDEHTIFAIGMLHKIEQGELTEEAPIASTVVHEVLSRRVLYLAVLLHDIAKGRGGDHSELGADLALRLCPRLGLSEEETEQVAWLVRYHLLMSNTAFKRDLDDPQTIATFAAQVQSLERLRLLLVLTVADIRAVGPKTWNNWKAVLLRELYWRTAEELSGGLSSAGVEIRAAAAMAALRQELADWGEAEIERHFARGPAAYWLAYDAPALARQARLVRRAEEEGAPLAIETRVDPPRGSTEVTVYAADRLGLFSDLAGAFALAGADIVDARIFTLTNGKALDSFTIQDAGGAFERPDKLARLAATIEHVITDSPGEGTRDIAIPPPALPSRAELFPVIPRVLIDNRASAAFTVIEVNGRDRKGLLHRLTRALADLKLQIANAKVSTFGARAVDVFYVKDHFGLKIDDERRLKAIRERLMTVLAEPLPAPGPQATNAPIEIAIA